MVHTGPVTITRRCRLPVDVIRPLGDPVGWRLAGELAAARDAVRATGAELADRVGGAVPAADRAARGVLLRLRRNAFNCRPLPDDVADVPPVDVAAYRAALAHATELADQVAGALAAHTERTSAALAELLAEPDFHASVELCTPELARPNTRHATSRMRRQSLTLLRLALRAATKPSPLARFTECLLVVPCARHRPAGGHVRFDSPVLRELAAWTATMDAATAGAGHWLTTNPTLRLSRTDETTTAQWLAVRGTAERIRAARVSDSTATLLRTLRRPAPAPAELPDAVVELVRLGAVELGCGHEPDSLRRLSDAWPAGSAPADALAVLNRLRADWSGAIDRDRTELVDRARDAVRGLADTLPPRRRPAADVTVTEDLHGVTAAPPAHEAPAPVVRPDLVLLQRILPLFGAELPFQLADAIAFRTRFADRTVPVCEAYRWYAHEGRAAAERLLAESEHPILRHVLALRDTVFDGLATLAGDRPETHCDPEWLRGIADALPGAVAGWACVAWLLQRAGDLVVVNGVAAGYGRLAARMSGVIGPHERAVLRDWAARAAVDPPGAVVVDVAAGFGAVVNEHVRLLPAALCYPGAALECDPDARIDLGTCAVRSCQDTGRLLLVDERRRPLLPVPHNGTLPHLGPPFYRWLVRFGPSLGMAPAFWDRVDERRPRTGVRHYPRLRLGELVLDRRTWKVPAADLPAAPDPVDHLVAWRRWCDRTSVPRRGFVRTATLPDPWDVVRHRAAGDGLAKARSRAGDSARKPQYVDLSQSLSRSALRAEGDQPLTFTEPLPDPEALADGDHVTEFVVETELPRRQAREGAHRAQ